MQLPRFYPILDTSRSLNMVEMAQAMTDGGVRILQIRHKSVWSEDLLEQAQKVKEIVPLLIINDRGDIARILNAGLHVGQTDLPPQEARRLLPENVIGFSTHSSEQFQQGAAEPVDYLAVGPVFQTSSKVNPDPVVGLNLLKEVRPLTSLPIVAIGGIHRGNAADVIHAGADSVAVIGDLYPEELTLQSLRQRVEEWVRLLS